LIVLPKSIVVAKTLILRQKEVLHEDKRNESILPAKARLILYGMRSFGMIYAGLQLKELDVIKRATTSELL
jgi:hypothetical protein